MTRNADGGAGHHPDAPANSAITATTKQHDHGQVSAVVVPAVAVDQPCPGRQMWQARVVDSRGHVHLHRLGPPREDGYRRTAPCGETYVIVVGGTE